jgi:hypothetical protein
MSQISLTSSDDDDKSYKWKKLKKACKKVKSIADWMLHKSSVSVDDCKAFQKELTPVLYKRKLADFFTFFCTHNQKNWKSKIVGRFSLLKLLFQK